jgi:DNA-3-methyladenine glycosylase II
MAYARDLAAKFLDGTLHHRRWGRMEDEAVIEELTAVKGIGRWTAEIYLMFAMKRPDVMPGNDLGLVVAAQHMKGLAERPKPKELVEIAEIWRPWRTAAALMLWHYNHNMPAMEG